MTTGNSGDEVRRRVRTPDPTLARSRPQLRPVTVERVPGIPAHLKAAAIDPPTKPKRQRIVLDYGAQSAAAAQLRSRVELAQQTSWGEMLIKDLISALLRSALICTAVGVALIGGLPVLFWAFPGFSSFTVAGVPIAWLVLGVGLVPLLYGIGLVCNAVSERYERAFVDMIES